MTIEDHDDRPERMVRDPDHYFAEARRRAVQEIMHYLTSRTKVRILTG
jgi:hypothetical protein